MIRFAAAAFGLLALATVAQAGDQNSQSEFVMPSNNVGCIYTPAGGTDTYQTADGLAELSCDRVEPSYVRVILGSAGKPKKYTNVGDASCCSTSSVLAYGEVWQQGPFTCYSEITGLVCNRGSHGFSMSRKAIKTH
jgi:hypothetical protein